MKHRIIKLSLAALVVLLVGVPSMAADARRDLPDGDETSSASDASGIVILEFLDVPQIPRQEKPRPKRRDPGRQNMYAVDSPCASAGFLGDLFGSLVGFDMGCNGDTESLFSRPR